jgi:hypothetical protein
MMMTEKNRATSMVVLIMVALNGLFLFGDGLFMLVVPSAWYHFVPGVTHTGPLNQHFIRDIGLIQMFLGGAYGMGLAQSPVESTSRRTKRCSRRRGMIGFWDFKLSGAPPLLSFGVRCHKEPNDHSQI